MKHNQNGAVNVLLVPLVVAVLILAAAVAFGAWAYSGRQLYKNNTQQQISTAVTTAKAQLTTQLNASFAQENQSPLDTYNGPEAYGSIILKYPKTWSAYVDDTGSGGAEVTGYFYPGILPALNSATSVFSLRFEILATPYSQTLQTFQGTSNSSTATDTITPYQLSLVPSVIGAEVSGPLASGITGTMIILPIRNSTLEVWTESTQYLSDFNNTILPNVSFSP
jgi:hypothetical protein